LWLVAINKLEKKRYTTSSSENTWDIDFFKDHHHQTYFAQGEVEMPEGQMAPTLIPDIVKNNIIFEVPMEDNRFGSKKLAHVKYAKNLLKELTEHL
jgi:CYTH domain-containing protein